MLSGIDYFVVIAYLTGILILGFYFRRFVHSSKDFFLGGRMLPFCAIGMSIVVSDIGAQDFVGVSGQAYRYGIAVGNFDWIGSVPAMLLAAFGSRKTPINLALSRFSFDMVSNCGWLWVTRVASLFTAGTFRIATAGTKNRIRRWSVLGTCLV